MSTLRKELADKKQKEQKVIEEAAEKWVASNIVLIHEKIDRRTIKALTDKIVKFDQMFGSFKDKLPSIAGQIESAEEGLQRVITGRVNDKKAMNLLKQLGYLYNTFSTFFTSDLPVVLSTPLLRAAKEHPDVKLSVLQHPSHKANVIRDALKNALDPSKDEQKLLKKIYRGSQPLIDTNAIANEMLNLSYHELEGLTKVGKVPMIDVPEEEPEALQEEHSFFLSEKIDTEKMQRITDTMEQIQSKLNIPGLEDVQQSVKVLVTKARREVIDGKWDIPGRPSAAKQLIMFYNVLDKMKKAWPTIKGTFSDGQLDAEELVDVKTSLAKAGQDSLFRRMTQALRTDHFPGLDPESIANSIAQALGDDANVDDVEALFKAAEKMPAVDSKGELAPSSDKTEKTDKTEPVQPGEQPVPTSGTTTQGTDVPVDKMTRVVKALRDRGLEVDDRDEVAMKNILDLFDQAGLKIS